ncbi:MAG: hypothetical protein K2X98_02135 [Alphaproteobacteria bacterium]|nr:hypothetical protein [Alphaproteobacteria bacterium]
MYYKKLTLLLSTIVLCSSFPISGWAAEPLLEDKKDSRHSGTFDIYPFGSGLDSNTVVGKATLKKDDLNKDKISVTEFVVFENTSYSQVFASKWASKEREITQIAIAVSRLNEITFTYDKGEYYFLGEKKFNLEATYVLYPPSDAHKDKNYLRLLINVVNHANKNDSSLTFTLKPNESITN